MIRAINKFLILGVPILLAGLGVVWAQPIPSGDDISAKAEAARERLGRFMRESIEPRLAYEYKEHFFDEKDAARLASLAAPAREDLQGIYDAQERMRKSIEGYEGEDWDTLYGATGLWRRICTDAQKTRLMKAQVDYYVALTAEPKERQRILQGLVGVCELSEPAFGRSAGLLKARALALMARSEKAFEEQARSGLELILSAGDLHDETYFESALEKLKLEPNPDSRQIEALAERLRRSRCADDFELNLKLAFLALRFGKAGFLKDLITKWPEAEDFAGRVILSEIVERRDEDNMTNTIFEVELAAKAARQKGIEKYKEPLVKLCRVERFQTPLLLYVTARACAESLPAEAVEYYLRATLARQKLKSSKLELDAVQIAEQGAKLAHKVYHKEPAHRRIVRRMIDYYCRIAGDRVDETVQYFYTRLLSGEGRTGEAIELLQKIAEKGGRFANRAKLDLIVHGLENGSEDLRFRHKLTEKLKNLIDSVDSTSEQDRGVKAEAVRLYCQLILENDDKASSQEVLTLLEETEGVDIQRSGILRAAALNELGRLPEAVRQLLPAGESNGCGWSGLGLEVLSAVLAGPVDQWAEEMPDFAALIQNCYRLGQRLAECVRQKQRPLAGLIYAEFNVLAGGQDKEKLAEAEGILIKLAGEGFDNDIDWLRCKARLLMAKGEFAAASRAWGRIRAARKTAAGKQSREWWRAKFYEIQCWGKLSDTTGAEVVHAVEVLLHTYRNIPEFWAMKLQVLKDDGVDQ